MDTVKQPQQELQSIVLGIPSELRAILGHNRLELRGKIRLIQYI